MIKTLIIGLGKIGLDYDYKLRSNNLYITHANSIKNHNKFKLVGGVDINKSCRLKFEKKFRVKSFKSYSEALRKTMPNLIILSTQVKDYVKVFKFFSENKNVKFVLFEKPFLINENEKKKIFKLSKKNNTNFTINFQRNFNPIYRKVIKKMTNGEIGKNINMYIWYTGKFFSNAIHFIPLFFPFTKNILKVNNNKNIEINFRKINMNFFNLKGNFTNHRLDIYGNKGKIEINSRYQKSVIWNIKKDKYFNGHNILNKKNSFEIDTLKDQLHVLNNIYSNIKLQKKLKFDNKNIENYFKLLKILKNKIKDK